MKKMIKGERPEALAQFAKAAKAQETTKAARSLTADRDTAPIATDNVDKHDVAETLLRQGAQGEAPDPEAAGEDKLPDRTRIGKKT
jgi:hypothetical protein